MVTASVQVRTLCGVEVDEKNQPLKAWSYSPADGDKFTDYEDGAYRAYTGVRRLIKHSDEWKAGYAAQLRLLPKKTGDKSGRAIAWGRYIGGETWHMGDNW